jgi:hypothetical protein
MSSDVDRVCEMSYRPEGGEYLHDEEEISKRCRRIIPRICPEP